MLNACGCSCEGCPKYKNECAGCREISGKVYWAEYIAEDVCPIYRCAEQKGFKTCGGCDSMPCKIWHDMRDPSQSIEQHERSIVERVNSLRAEAGNYELVRLDARTVMGIEIRTTNENMQALSDIPPVWQKFMELCINKGRDTIGLYTDYESDYTAHYTFIACSETTDESNAVPLTKRTIPAGLYARFSSRGNMQETVAALWTKIWGLNLNRKYASDFELYHGLPDENGDIDIDIYISLND